MATRMMPVDPLVLRRVWDPDTDGKRDMVRR